MRLVHKSMAAVASAASKDISRRFLTGIHYEELPNGKARLTATDGNVLIRVETGDEAVKPEDFPVISGVEWSEAVSEAIIPSQAFVDALKGIPRSRGYFPILENMAVHVEGGDSPIITLATTDSESPSVKRVRPIPGPFPRADTVIPQGPPVFTITVDPDKLASVLTMLGRKHLGLGGNDGITFRFYGRYKPFAIDGLKSATALTSLAVMAPMRPYNEKMKPEDLEPIDQWAARGMLKSLETIIDMCRSGQATIVDVTDTAIAAVAEVKKVDNIDGQTNQNEGE